MPAPLSISLSQSASILALIAYIKTVLPCAPRNAGQLVNPDLPEQRKRGLGTRTSRFWCRSRLEPESPIHEVSQLRVAE
eukprot:3818389-Rhodomonas_salina.1